MSPSDLIKRFESCRLKAYPDPATGGRPWTCGWGCTGPSVGPDTIWTQEQADAELEHRLEALEDVLSSLVHVDCTPGEWAALCSLAWNIGTDALAKSTLLRELNARNFGLAAAEFLKWDLANGHVMPGLVKRRAAERAVFLDLPDTSPGKQGAPT